MPRARARQRPASGQMRQLARRGAQTVAPRSMRAWAKSPGRCAGTSLAARARISGLASGQRRLDGESPRDHPLDIAVDGSGGTVEGDGGNGGGGIRPDAGQGHETRLIGWKAAAQIARDGDGALVQLARPGVVAQTRPFGQHLIEAGGGEVGNARPAGDEAAEIGRDGGNRGLLQHDLRQPYPVGIGSAAGRGTPGQIAAVAVIPGKQERSESAGGAFTRLAFNNL